MKITILFFSFFREHLGIDRIDLFFNESISLMEVLKTVDSRFNGILWKLLFKDDGSIRSDIHIAVNMSRIDVKSIQNTFLSDDSIIAILPAPSGG
ncbi:MAG: MoaD/ThiS family protein [Candidatus Methanomethylicia archaeon]|nr:MoaD/ThiS family protein [Candidatus Methanomethylicia archaeon]